MDDVLFGKGLYSHEVEGLVGQLNVEAPVLVHLVGLHPGHPEVEDELFPSVLRPSLSGRGKQGQRHKRRRGAYPHFHPTGRRPRCLYQPLPPWSASGFNLSEGGRTRTRGEFGGARRKETCSGGRSRHYPCPYSPGSRKRQLRAR